MRVRQSAPYVRGYASLKWQPGASHGVDAPSVSEKSCLASTSLPIYMGED